MWSISFQIHLPQQTKYNRTRRTRIHVLVENSTGQDWFEDDEDEEACIDDDEEACPVGPLHSQQTLTFLENMDSHIQPYNFKLLFQDSVVSCVSSELAINSYISRPVKPHALRV